MQICLALERTPEGAIAHRREGHLGRGGRFLLRSCRAAVAGGTRSRAAMPRAQHLAPLKCCSRTLPPLFLWIPGTLSPATQDTHELRPIDIGAVWTGWTAAQAVGQSGCVTKSGRQAAYRRRAAADSGLSIQCAAAATGRGGAPSPCIISHVRRAVPAVVSWTKRCGVSEEQIDLVLNLSTSAVII